MIDILYATMGLLYLSIAIALGIAKLIKTLDPGDNG